MENKVFDDMPEAPVPPKLPKHFPDLQGRLAGKTPGAGWFQNDFMPWFQEQGHLIGYGLGLTVLLASAVGLSIGAYHYQDQIQDIVTGAAQGAQDIVSGAVQGAQAIVAGVSQATMDAWTQATGKIMEITETATNGILAILTGMWDKIKGNLGLNNSDEATEKIEEITETATTGILDKIKSATTGISDKIKNTVGLNEPDDEL